MQPLFEEHARLVARIDVARRVMAAVSVAIAGLGRDDRLGPARALRLSNRPGDRSAVKAPPAGCPWFVAGEVIVKVAVIDGGGDIAELLIRA